MNHKLAEARILASRKMPYLTHQVMTLIPVERPGLGTMAVDEYCRLYFDPAFLEGRDLKHLAFVVLHEAIHVWSRHGKRCVRLLGEKPASDRLEIWRHAVDAAVNDVLEQSGLRCPDEGVTPAKLGLPRNKTAEEYFDLLMRRAAEQEEKERAARKAEQEQNSQEQSGDADQSDGDGQGSDEEGQSDQNGQEGSDASGDDAAGTDCGEDEQGESEGNGEGEGQSGDGDAASEGGEEGQHAAEIGGSAADGQPTSLVLG